MRRITWGFAVCVVFAGLPPVARAQQGGCSGPDGSRFNLEPRPNAVVQAAQSVAFLPNEPNGDLVVATATDMRGLAGSTDVFYVQRSGSGCVPNLEGGLPNINNIVDLFVPFGTATVIADPARRAFFIVDLRFGLSTDDNGLGILRTTTGRLTDASACPDGTQAGSASCFSVGAVTNITDLNAFLDNPHIAVDPRTTGTGAGDVYTVVGQRSSRGLSKKVTLTACTNASLACGNSITISGGDVNADFPYVQVRPDGAITISYRNTTFPGVNPEDIKFVTCTPSGAPAAPVCGAPVLVTTEKNPVFATTPGDVPMLDELYPRHAHRVESDGTTVTTFLTYDRCEVPIIQQTGLGSPFCPKAGVALTTSTDGGVSWSSVTGVAPGKGQKFFSTIVTDTSTGTVNLVYYSTENDPFQQRPQVFLVQAPRGTTSPGPATMLTANVGDVQAGPPLVVFLQPAGFGDRLGVAAGQNRVYTTFTWNSVPGLYASTPSPDMNNHLSRFVY